MADDAEALRLIDKAVLALQARQHPGRPMFYALERLRSDVRQAQATLPVPTPHFEGRA